MPVLRNFRYNTSVKEANSESGIRSSRKISKKLDIIDQKMNGLYRDIYVSRPDNKDNLDNIIDDLDLAIDKLQLTDSSTSGMSELLRRISLKNNVSTKDLEKSVEELFSDQRLLTSLFANTDIHRYISGQNYNYDLICKYIPKLLDALELKRDNVLSSDNFSKDFINPKSVKSSKMEANQFAANTKRLEEEYEISEFLEKTYMNTSKYGEDFIYIVPYKLAFKRLLTRSNERRYQTSDYGVSFYESIGASNISSECVTEGFIETQEFKDYQNNIKGSIGLDISEFDKQFKGFQVNLVFNESNVILDKVNDICVLENKKDMDKFKSLSSIFIEAAGDYEKNKKNLDIKFNKISNFTSSSDGLILDDNLERDPNKLDDINGVVLERLPRENIIPIYIGKKCLGYYYLDFQEDSNACGFCGSNHMTPGVSNAATLNRDMSEDQQELAIRFISSKISASIDTKFINANKDLKEEIYSILRYNEKFDLRRSNNIAVSFIPADDIIHCYFEKDETTHRGISDLQKALIPSMLYILLYLTDIIGKITRSTDKRIYYVKQNVETNVARTMMNVVQQIKKGNMGMRQIESMNNILNIVGKYNDYIIPMGQSGDPPISFEVMQGQDIQTPTDIMEKMEEMAVNTVVPFEMVNSSYQQDFAIRFSMSNIRFLKSVYTRQRKTQRFFSEIYTKVYNFEFEENNPLIEIILPPPTYLSVTNNQQLLDSLTSLVDKIIELEYTGEDDEELKAEFKKIYIKSHLSTYLDYESIERIKETAKVNVESRKDPAVDTDNSDNNDFDGL